jgi:ribosomal protein S12 methylthiotransferase accessory factor
MTMAGPTRAGADVEALVSSFGVVSRVGPMPVPRGLDRVAAFGAVTGSGNPGKPYTDPLVGVGRAIDDPLHARLVAIAEGAERYAAKNAGQRRFVWDTAEKLRNETVDVWRLPKCTAREYADEGCRFVPFDPAAAIRWTRCVDLVTKRELMMPAVMGCYCLASPRREERFWHQISTGNAVHFDPAEALVQGIFEVVERDAIALTWLQKLPLPLLDAAPLCSAAGGERLAYLLDWNDAHFITTYLYDATTDLGIPTVYCLQAAEHDAKVRHVVGAATCRTMADAAEKAVLEVVLIRAALASKDVPATPGEFRDVVSGALYMGVPERAHAFDFLVDRPSADAVSPPRSGIPEDPRAALDDLLHRLSDNRMQVLAVDVTCSELSQVGLTAVSVVIPDLQPMCLDPIVQFRAHRRLYDAPGAMGYRTLAEDEVNPWPQPFA